MIRISLNDIDLDLGKVSIPFKFENPLFTGKIFNEGYSFTFTIPETEKNRSALSNSQRFDARIVGRKYDIKFYFKGLFMFAGAITVKDIVNANIQCYFNSVGLNLNKSLSNIKLRDLDLHTRVVCLDADTPSEKQTKWEAHMIGHLQGVTFPGPGDPEISHYFPPIHSPSAYDDDFEVDPTVTVTGFTKNHWWSQFINLYWLTYSRYSVQNRVLNSVYALRPGWQTTISPCPRFIPVMRAALTKLGFILDENDLLSETEIQNLFIYSNEVMDKIETTGSHTYNVYGLDYDLKDFLPDLSALSLFIGLKEVYNAIFYEEDGRIKTITGKDLLSDSPEDWTKYADEAFANQFNEFSNYVYSWKTDKDDQYTVLFSDQFIEEKIISPDATGEIKITPGDVRPLASRVAPRGSIWGTFVGVGTDETSIDVITGPLIEAFENKTSLGYNAAIRSQLSEIRPDDIQETLLLGVWRGVDFAGTFYPYAVNQATDSLGVIYGEKSILWADEDGLVNNFHEDFLNYVNGSRSFDNILYLPPHKVAELAKFRHVKKSFETPNGKVTGILKEFEVTFTNEGMSPVKATYLTKD